MSSSRSAGRSGGRATRAERAAGKTDTAAAGSGDGTGSSQNHQERPAKSHTHHSKLREEKVYEDKISQVVQLTGKTKDEAEIALYDCDYDPTRAINMLLEGDDQGEWVEKTKKKKPPKPSPPEPKQPQEESFRPQEEERGERDRSRGGRGGSQPPRLRRGAGPDRSWKARESRENEKNAAGGGGAGGERTRWGRGGARGGRGGRRGGLGSRSFQGRSRGDDFSAIDTWTNPGDDGTGGGSWDQSFPSTDDWDNEEWAGSLTDTKVFTPSTPAQPPPVADVSPTTTAGPVPPPASSLGPSLDLSALLGKSPTSGGGGTTNGGDSYSQFGSGSDGDSARSPPTASSAPSASAAYSYSNATARSVAAPQNSAPAPAAASYPSGYTNPPGLIYSSSGYTPSESYQSHVTSSAPSATATTASQPQSIPQHSTGRTRVNRTTPKIPESAVEMPSDLVSSLEVKFGGLDFFSADGPARRVNIISPSTGLPVLAGSEGNGADGYSSASQSVSVSEQTTLPLSSASQTVKSALEPTSAGYSVTSSAPAAVPSSASSFPPAPGLYSSPQKSSAPAAATSSTASSAPAGFPPAPSVSGATFAQLSAGYSGQVTAPGFSQAAGFPSSTPASSNSPPSAFSQPSAVSSAFPGSGSFASSNYSGAGAGAYNGGSYTSGTLAGTSLQEKLTNALSGAVKASQYDPSSVAMSVGVSTAASSLPAGLTSSAANSAANSVQNSAGRQHPASTRSGNMPSVPPGVPMQYFVGQGGMPTFYPGVQQIYGYEDMQALQQRLPHLQQQAAAQQAAGNNQGRGDATSALAAAMADASKYSRDASSPIQSSLNQQGQQQQQPFFNAAAAAAAAAAMPPNYTYFPFVPQYSIYTPMPPATNAAHQASSGGASQYPKMAYNAASFAGSSYDTLASAPGGDYKAAAAAGPFGGSAAHKLAGSGSVAGGSADLYGKVQQLGGKYDNKGFHAATPPPFGLAGGQPQQQPLAAPGGYAPHLFIQPLPAQHQLVHPSHAESAGAGGPQRANAANKPAAKNSYGGGYWPAN